jgi:hypothetical protein
MISFLSREVENLRHELAQDAMAALKAQAERDAHDQLTDALDRMSRGEMSEYITCIAMDTEGLPPNVVRETLEQGDRFLALVTVNETKGTMSIEVSYGFATKLLGPGEHAVPEDDRELTPEVLRHTLLNVNDADEDYVSTRCAEFNADNPEGEYMSYRGISVDMYCYRCVGPHSSG